MSQAHQEHREVAVCGIAYSMQLVEGGVLFAETNSIVGLTRRLMFEYRYGLWYLSVDAACDAPACHLKRMHALLEDLVYRDGEGGDHAPERWRDAKATP